MRITTGLTVLLALIYIGCTSPEVESPASEPPNIILFLADDLGYGELGSYGQKKIETPHLDALAARGMRFTQFYSGAPVCAPARYVLLTGLHTGHAFIRGNDEWKERGDVWDYARAVEDPTLEGQRPIPLDTVTVGKVLRQAGYRTAVVGKWGLGAPHSEGIPTEQGFDYFFGYNCQRQAHNLYPVHLWENLEKVLLDNELVAPSTKLDAAADPYDEASYARFAQRDYAPAKMQEKALAFIRDNAEQPFFLYYATPLPHLPLQVPRAQVDRYRARFGDEEPYIGDQSYFPHRYPRAAYAGMISTIDDQIGELVAALEAEGILEQTLFIFSSDNGPTYLGGVDADFFDSAGPFSNDYGRTKGFTYEGGIRVPMIVSWPGRIAPGAVTDHISAFYDFLPTLSEVAGIAPPAGIDGISFVPTLLSEGEQVEHPFLYWEFPSYNGQQAVRMGPWKGIRKDVFDGNLAIELYDLEKDPAETIDVADQFPEIVAEIERVMRDEHVPAENERFRFEPLGDSR